MDNPKTGKRIIAVGGSHMIFPQNFCHKKMGIVIPEVNIFKKLKIKFFDIFFLKVNSFNINHCIY